MQTEYIYRYMSLGEFVDVLLNKRLTLKYPGNWPDKLETLFLKAFTSEESCTELIKEYQKHHSSYNESHIKTDLQIISARLLQVRCQCWTKNKDDLRMWQSRNSNESVCISIKRESLDTMNIKHSNIVYKPFISIKALISGFEDAERWLPQFVMEKKECYSYENEVRIYKFPDDWDVTSCSCYSETLSEFLTLNFLWLKKKFGVADKFIAFDTSCITDVFVHPSATDVFVDNVKQLGANYLCSNVNIKRSEILD